MGKRYGRDMDLEPTHALTVGARSEIGPRRPNNQDSGHAGDDLLLVADGVGGSPSGDLASALMVRTLTGLLRDRAEYTEFRLRDQVAVANARLARAGREHPALKGMATTLTGLVLTPGTAYLVHVGDSRAYRWRDGVLAQQTADQSWIQVLLDQGLVAPADARHHPMRNMLLHSLSGAISDPEAVQILPIELRRGDRWLLATDGLTSYLPADELATITARVKDPQDLADDLVEQTWARSKDNITVVVGDVVNGRPVGRGRFIGAAAGVPSGSRRRAV